jgi:hypothetical protein
LRRVFSGFHPTGGNLQQVAPNCRTILPYQNNVTVVVEGNHRYRTAMLDDLSIDGLTVCQPDVVHSQIDDATLINPAAAYHIAVFFGHSLPHIVTPYCEPVK